MPPPPAATISVRDTLDLLDNSFPSFAEGVADGRYAFWLGSGISLGVVPGLWGVVETVIEFLRANTNRADATCKFNRALVEALQLAGLPFRSGRNRPATRSFRRCSRTTPDFSPFVSERSRSTTFCGTSSKSLRLTPPWGFSPMSRIYALLRSALKVSRPKWCRPTGTRWWSALLPS